MSRAALEKLRQPDNGLSLEERWNLMAPYWPFAKTTGYGRAMTAYMRDLFGIDDINETTWAELSRRINDARSRPGWYRTVLKDKANIDCSLVITWPGEPVAVDRAFFRAVPILDHYAIPGTRAELEQLEKEAACSIQTPRPASYRPGDHADASPGSIAAVKIFPAYRRTLRFDRVKPRSPGSHLAQPTRTSRLTTLNRPGFHDLHLHRRPLRGLPIQIHTGCRKATAHPPPQPHAPHHVTWNSATLASTRSMPDAPSRGAVWPIFPNVSADPAGPGHFAPVFNAPCTNG